MGAPTVFEQESRLQSAEKGHAFKTIYVDEFSPVIPFCREARGGMKLGCIENLSSRDCVVFIEGTEMRYNLHANERLLCVLSADDTFVQAIDRVQYRNGEFIFLDADTMHIIYSGIFNFYRNGMLEFELKSSGEKFCFRRSDRGNFFVFASQDGVIIDSEGYIKTSDDRYHRYNKWSSHYYVETFPEEKQYLYAAYKGRAGITLDRLVVYEEDYIRGIPDPAVAIALSWAGLWVLSTKGQLYLADVENNLDAVLIAENAAAISSSTYERNFVYADTEGNLYVYNCSDFRLKTDGDRTYLCPRYGKEKEYVPQVLHPGRGRISEIVVHKGEAAFRCLHGGRDIISLSDDCCV